MLQLVESDPLRYFSFDRPGRSLSKQAVSRAAPSFAIRKKQKVPVRVSRTVITPEVWVKADAPGGRA